MPALQRTAGNQAVYRAVKRAGLLQRDPIKIGIRVAPPELDTVGQHGGRLPGLLDPRKQSTYVDNRITAVGYGLRIGGYLLYLEGQKLPVLVPERFVEAPAPARPVGDAVHADYDHAIRTVPSGPWAQDEPRPYAYYEAPGEAGVVVPTLFTRANAPRTVDLIVETVKQLVDFATAWLNIAAFQIAGDGVSTVFGPILIRGARWLGARGFGEAPGGKLPGQGVGEGEAAGRAKDPAAVVPSVRPRLQKADLRRLRAEARDWVVFRTRDLDVAQNQAIKPTGATNPMVAEDVCFVEGLEGIDYGPYAVAIKKADLPGVYPVKGAAPEWRFRGEVPAEKGFWYTIEDLKAAFMGAN